MSKNGKRLQPVNTMPNMEAAKVTITAFIPGGPPPRLESTTDLAGTLSLLSIGINTIAASLMQQQAQAKQQEAEERGQDKQRQFMGPREG